MGFWDFFKLMYGDDSFIRPEFEGNGLVLQKYNQRNNVTDVVVPDNFCAISMDAFRGNTQIKSIVLPRLLVGIQMHSFKDCTSLESVVLPQGIKKIESGAFEGCTSLRSIDIPQSVTSIGKGAFKNCTSLVRVNIPKAVTELPDELFFGCRSLTRLPLHDGIVQIGAAVFANCRSLQNIKLPAMLRDMGADLFHGCASLENVKLPRALTKLMPNTFRRCTSLKKAELPQLISVIDEGVFEDCKALQSVVIPDNVSYIGRRAFSGCESLTELELPDSVISVHDGAFAHCTSLVRIVLHDLIYCKCGDPFNDCPAQIVYERIPEFYSDNLPPELALQWETEVTYDHTLRIKRYKGAETVVSVPAYIDSCKVTAIGRAAFDSSAVETVSLPDSISVIEPLAFQNCKSLRQIEIPHRVYKIPTGVFRGCSSLHSVTLSEGLGSIEPCAFDGCNALTRLVIPKSVTALFVDPATESSPRDIILQLSAADGCAVAQNARMIMGTMSISTVSPCVGVRVLCNAAIEPIKVNKIIKNFLALGFAKGIYSDYAFDADVIQANHIYISENRSLYTHCSDVYMLRYLAEHGMLTLEDIDRLIYDNKENTALVAQLLEYRLRYFPNAQSADEYSL